MDQIKVSTPNKKKTDQRKTGGGPPPAELTPAEELALDGRGGRGEGLDDETLSVYSESALAEEGTLPPPQPGPSTSRPSTSRASSRQGVKPGPINSMVFTKPVPNRMVQTGEWILQRHGGAITRSLPVQSYGGILSIEDRPLVTTMNMRCGKCLRDCAGGQCSVLSDACFDVSCGHRRTTWCKEYTQIQKCKEQSEKK
ncbi:hypothetical protein JOQ06_023366 [Pogonophryne albipinna]|uniref:Uncharacterized protein n=1 Tax=Pogonophryne albipinna TaxID=1090488 RepID=A0AAD6BMU1_9TELE|nr:hypothetical protein JOQ06_023366 [Pogonophryne albipinna]